MWATGVDRNRLRHRGADGALLARARLLDFTQEALRVTLGCGGGMQETRPVRSHRKHVYIGYREPRSEEDVLKYQQNLARSSAAVPRRGGCFSGGGARLCVDLCEQDAHVCLNNSWSKTI